MLETNSFEIYVVNILHEIGLPSHINGYKYVKYAIILIHENPYILHNMNNNMYSFIAENFNTTISRVERSIRHAIEIGFVRGNLKTIDNIFGYSINIDKCRPTNFEFITSICEKTNMLFKTV